MISACKPLAERAIKFSPDDTKLWRLILKLNSKRTTYAGRSRESEQAFKGALFKSPTGSASDLNSVLNADPTTLAQQSL